MSHDLDYYYEEALNLHFDEQSVVKAGNINIQYHHPSEEANSLTEQASSQQLTQHHTQQASLTLCLCFFFSFKAN